MGWLKKLFAKPEEKEQEIHIDSLPGWFMDKTKAVHESFEKTANEYIRQIGIALNKLEEQISVLEDSEIEEEDRIQGKIKNVVLGHKGNYIRMLNQLINSIKPPADMAHNSILNFLDTAEKNLDEFAKNSTKSYYASQHLFHRQIEETAKIISEISRLLGDIRKSAEKGNIIQVSSLQEKIKYLGEQIGKKEKLELKLEETRKKLQEAESSKQLAEKKIQELGQSRDAKDLDNLKKELNGIKNDLLQLETNILQLFSPLERALKKFSKITLEDEKLAEAYASNPISALLSDSSLKIISLLHNTKKNILSNSIELRDKQREKTLEIIDSITKEQLANFVYKYSTLQEKIESLEKQVKAHRAVNQEKELQYKLEHAKWMLGKIRNELAEVEKTSERIDISQLKAELENNLKELLKQEIKIN